MGNKNRRPEKIAMLKVAYGKVLETEGYEAAGINKVSQVANLEKSQVYRAEPDFENLRLSFALEHDYWLNCMGGIDTEKLAGPERAQQLKTVIIALLQNQLLDYYEEPVKRELIANSIDKKAKPVQRLISEQRDAEGERLFKHTDVLFAGSSVPFRGIAAILVGGSDFLALHARHNRTRVCGLDVNDERTKGLFLRLIDTLINKAFARIGY